MKIALFAILTLILATAVSANCYGNCYGPGLGAQEWVTYHPQYKTVPKVVYEQQVSYKPVVHGMYYQPVQNVQYKPYYEVKYKPIVKTNYIPQYYSYTPGQYGGAW